MVLWAECLYFAPNSYVEILTLKVRISRGGTFWGRLYHEDRALIDEIGALTTEREPSSHLSCEVTAKQPCRKCAVTTESADALVLDFQPPDL